MKNICIFTQSLSNGGAEKQAVQLANSLIDRYNISILIYYGNQVEVTLLCQISDVRIRVIRLKGCTLKKLHDIYSLFKKEKYYIVFCYLLLPNLLGGILGKLAGISFTIGGIRSSKLDRHKVLLNKIIQNNINYLTIYNNYSGVQQLSLSGFNQNKAFVIPNGHEAKNAPIVRESREIKEILSVGRFHHSKDYKTALESIAAIQNKKSVRYTIIGYGEMLEAIREWIQKYDLVEIVKIVIKPPDLAYYYRKADIFLQTSIFEGLSNTVMEAMSFSLPVVTTNVGDNEKLVIDGVSGYLNKPCDFLGIAHSLEKLINDYPLRISMGREGYSLLYLNYSMPIFKKRYIDFIAMLDGN